MPDEPYELQKLVTVATYNFPWEAQVAKARLAAFGIPSLIAGEHTIRMVALTYAFGGLQVQVPEHAAAAAHEVLRAEAPLPEIYLVQAGETAEGMTATAEAEPLEEGRGALVTVARFRTTWEAHLARTLLESAGIEACVFEDRVPLVSLLSGIAVAHNRLEVRDEDAERAGTVLAEARASEPPDEDEEEAVD
jgi:hypothetical protein